MAHVSDSRNSMAFIFHMEYTKLAKMVYRNIRGRKTETRNIDVNVLGVQ